MPCMINDLFYDVVPHRGGFRVMFVRKARDTPMISRYKLEDDREYRDADFPASELSRAHAYIECLRKGDRRIEVLET
jgi:hypothetical protein